MNHYEKCDYKVGVKDDLVYYEGWCDDYKVVDGTFSVENARGFASDLIKAADRIMEAARYRGAGEID